MELGTYSHNILSTWEHLRCQKLHRENGMKCWLVGYFFSSLEGLHQLVSGFEVKDSWSAQENMAGPG